MKHTLRIHLHLVTILAVSVFALGQLVADTVKTKDGKTYEGKITLQTDDVVKIRVQTSASISETKTFLMTEVAEVLKSAPDDVDFAKIKGLLPTPSLVTTSNYRAMIEQGPGSFLNSYPNSKHREAVEKIKKELEDELAKVDRGFIKIEGEWISPDNQQDFRELIDARILNLALKQKAQGANYIGALRDFETMEENFYGTPSYVEAVKTIKQLLPVFGQRLQRMVRDVDYENEQFQTNLAKMPERARAQVVAARQQEEAALKARFEADKAGGVKWYSVNTRDKEDLTAYINLVSEEIEKLNSIDLFAEEERAKGLVKVDELLAEGKLDKAREALSELTGYRSSRKSRSGSSTGQKYKSGYGSFGKSGGGSRSSRTSKAKQKTNYAIALQTKIETKDAAIAAANEAATNSAEGAAAVGVIRSEDVMAAAPPLESETVEGQQGSNAGSAALKGLIDATEKPKKEEPAKSTKAKPKKPVKKADKDDDEEKKPRPVASGGGFQFKFKYVIWIVTALLVASVVAMKVLGIGAKES